MAVAQPLRFQKKKMVLYLQPMFHQHNSKPTLTTKTCAFKDEERSSSVYVRTLCKEGRLKEALHILHLMLHPDSDTYASILQGCLNKKSLPECKLVHAHIIRTGFKCEEISLENKLVTMYAKCGTLVDARRVFDQMVKRNVVSWTVMIAACVRHGLAKEALTLYYQMQRIGIQPNQFTFASVLPACAILAVLEHGKEIHKEIIRSEFETDVFVGSALVDMYVKCGKMENAHQVFDKMPERDAVSWTSMIAGYAQNRRVDEAVKLFQKMPERDLPSWNAMIAGYAHNGYIDEAQELFQKMPERDVISWTSLIAGYAQNGHFDNALNLYGQMLLTGVNPNSDTFASILPACANLAALQHGKEVHEDIIRSGFQSDIYVGSALVDMYAKCGSIENAFKVFDKLPRRDVISWTAMIEGYALHGRSKEALQLFQQMQKLGTKPNDITFIAVLSACCHAGLVEDGWQYFNCMRQYHHITPVMEHYCCMVDLLGRAGYLDEAEDFINKMPIKPDAAVWGSLLGACRTHTNIKLGERVAGLLLEVDPKNAASYVLLSNIYATAGRWDDIGRIRKLMKDKGVKKKPGCSWIEVNKQVHAFVVGDRSQPQSHKIHEELERLSRQIK